MKEKRITFNHKVDGRSKNFLMVATIGDVDAVEAVTYRGARFDVVERKKYWKLQWRFPFLVRKEHGLYTATIQPKKRAEKTDI